MKWLVLRLILLFLWTMQLGFASEINVEPVTLVIPYKEKTTLLNVTNQSSIETTTLQLDVFKWQQYQQDNKLVATNEVILSPPVFQLRPGETQLVRIAWLRSRQLREQLTYRVLIRELGSNVQLNQPLKRLRLNLSLSLPLFIEPEIQHSDYQLKYNWISDNVLKIRFKNTGNTTYLLNELQIKNNRHILFDEKSLTYILPKREHVWHIAMSKQVFNNIAALLNGEWTIRGVKQ